MNVTFERIYYADVTPQEPPLELRRQAEKQAVCLLPTRRHVFYSVDGRHLTPTCMGSICWRITYSPEVNE